MLAMRAGICTCRVSLPFPALSPKRSFNVLNWNSSNNIAGNVLICIAMLVFLVVSTIVPRDSGFQRQGKFVFFCAIFLISYIAGFCPGSWA
jgi:uncharacterized membrane protein